MDNFEKDMQKLVLDLLTKEVQGPGTSEEKIDDQNAIQGKQDAVDTRGKGSTTTVAEEKLDLCQVCQTKADKTCGGCKSISYCSVEHQRLDWKAHKKCCSPFIIKETGTMGKGWIATRDLPADTILLEELPALYAPRWTHLDSPCCVTCGIAMITTENKDRTCSTCSWPICSEKCENSSIHTENECNLFPLHKKKLTAVLLADHFCFQLLVLRASNLKLKNRQVFDKLMELQDFHSIPNKNKEVRDKCHLIFTLYKNSYFGLQQYDLTDEECEKLRRICWVNSFQQTDKEEIGWTVLLYLQSSTANHSCNPNCTFSPGTPPDFKMRVRTAIPVKKGESLTITYLETIQTEPTSIRQQSVLNQRGFICRCERCLDPTELGTFMTGIKCQKCRAASKNNENADENFGYFLPENPLDLSFEPVFKCNGCGELKLFSVLKSCLPSEIQRAFEENENPEKECESFLAEYETGGNYLHKNHYLIQTRVREIAFRREKVMSMNVLELKQTLCRMEYLLQVENEMFPGYSRSKVDVLFQFIMTGGRMLNRFWQQMSPEEVQKLLCTIQTNYEAAIQYLEKDNSSLGKWMLPNIQAVKNRLREKFGL